MAGSIGDAVGWFGAKRRVKDVLSLPVVNPLLVAVARLAPESAAEQVSRLPVAVPEVEGRVRDLRYLLTDPGRCAIAKELFWGRGERVRPDERHCLELFVDLARRADHVLDIGANTGVFALLGALANPRARVDAFEIVPDVYEVLFRNLVRNDVVDRVRPHLLGVGGADQSLRVPSFAGASSLPTSVSADHGAAEGARVGFVTFEAVTASDADDATVLVKIDVEGTEDQIVEHGREAFRRLRPDTICEILRRGNRRGLVSELVREVGYSTYLITDDGLERRDALEAHPRFRDWFFTTKSADELRAATAVPVRG